MRYLDSGRRDAGEAVGTWLDAIVRDGVEELRFQTGFFSRDALRWIAPALERLRDTDSLVRAVVGSNDGGTTDEDVDALAVALGLPRSTAQLGVVTYTSGYFHPKTIHVRLVGGRSVAYVGSANLTRSGISGLHVEAGLVLDSSEGDDSDLLATIAQAVDAWFVAPVRPGFHPVTAPDDVAGLVAAGVLTEASVAEEQRRARESAASGAGRGRRYTGPGLQPLVAPPEAGPRGVAGGVAEAAATYDVSRPVEDRPDYPDIFRFAPGAEGGAMSGIEALSGQALPDGMVGLIVRLNRDTARRALGGPGTANLTIPMSSDVLRVFRFGLDGTPPKPRVELPLSIRFVADNGSVGPYRAESASLIGYGFHPDETSHRNVRLTIPVVELELQSAAEALGWAVPAAGNFALLEWPTPGRPTWSLTYLEPSSSAHSAASEAFNEAVTRRETVGRGACWLSAAQRAAWLP